MTGGKIFCSVGGGFADGFRCDVDGRIWSTAGDGVEIFAPDGHLIGKILMGAKRPNNLCFGGPQYKTLFTVGQPNVCSFPVLVAGAVSIRKLAACTRWNQFPRVMAGAVHGIQLADIRLLGRPGSLDKCCRLATSHQRIESTGPVRNECREVFSPAFELIHNAMNVVARTVGHLPIHFASGMAKDTLNKTKNDKPDLLIAYYICYIRAGSIEIETSGHISRWDWLNWALGFR